MYLDAAIKVNLPCNECIAMLPLRLECLVGARLEHWRNVPSHTTGICEVRINQHARLHGGAVFPFFLKQTSVRAIRKFMQVLLNSWQIYTVFCNAGMHNNSF